MTFETILNAIRHFFAGTQFDQHALLIFAGGYIAGSMMHGRGAHRQLMSAYRRFRPW